MKAGDLTIRLRTDIGSCCYALSRRIESAAGPNIFPAHALFSKTGSHDSGACASARLCKLGQAVAHQIDECTMASGPGGNQRAVHDMRTIIAQPKVHSLALRLT